MRVYCRAYIFEIVRRSLAMQRNVLLKQHMPTSTLRAGCSMSCTPSFLTLQGGRVGNRFRW